MASEDPEVVGKDGGEPKAKAVEVTDLSKDEADEATDESRGATSTVKDGVTSSNPVDVSLVDADDGKEEKDAIDEEKEKEIAEEYRVWKKNTPFLYDLVMTHALEWPSLTVQWLPESLPGPAGSTYEQHKLLLGTHTSGEEQNYLMVATVHLPNEDAEIDARKYDDEREEVGGFGGVDIKISTSIRINHEGEVNKARYMPQNPFVVATKGPSSGVYVFDVSKHPSNPAPGSGFNPDHRCLGHSKEGYGLSWSGLKEGYLISGSEDELICHWDVAGSKEKEIQPLRTWKGHSGAVGDVAWHCRNENLLGSVGYDGSLFLWDTAQQGSKPVYSVHKAHAGEANCLAFSHFSPFLVATGGSDGVVCLWDMRNLSQKIHALEGHESDVLQIAWNPISESLLASCSADRRAILWDLSRIGMEQSPEDAEDGPPEVLFIHGGHTDKVADLSWNPNAEGVLATTSEDNIIQIWQPAGNILAGDEESEGQQVDDSELE